MSKLRAKGWMVFPIAALVFVALGAVLLARGDLASGSATATVRIGSGHGDPGSQVTVPLEALGLTQALGAITVDIVYDDSLEPTAWNKTGSPLDMVTCSLAYALHTIRCTGISAAGASGDVLIANLTFHLVGAAGECDPLDVQIVTFADPNGNPISASDTDGQICMDGGPSPSPSPSPSPTATVTPTPPPTPTAGAKVRIGSGWAGQSSEVTVPLEALDVPAPPGLGAITVDIVYDDSLEPTAWNKTGSPLDMVTCSLAYAANTIRCTGISAAGASGDVLITNLTFRLVASPDECDPLDVQIVTFADPDGNPIPVTDEDGEICIGGSPTPTARVRIGSGQGDQGTDVIVPLEALGLTQALGAITVDIVYDASLEPTAWDKTGSPLDMVTCSLAYAPNTIRCSGISAEGVFGDILVANITFHLVGPCDECDPLDVQVVTFADPDGNPIPFTDEDGQICINPCDGEATVRIEPETSYVAPGSEVTVRVEAVDVPEPGLGTFRVDITCDPGAVVQVTDCVGDPDGLFPGIPGVPECVILEDDPCHVRLGSFRFDPGATGAIALGDITFVAIGDVDQSTALSVEVLELVNSDDEPIPYTTQGGEIRLALMCGDANCDQQVGMLDAKVIAKFAMGIGPEVCSPPAADVNCDHSVGMVDAKRVAEFVMGLRPELECCPDIWVPTPTPVPSARLHE